METELTTTRKNDELQLCYDLKKDSAGHLTELQRIVSKLTEIPKSQIKAKRDLCNVLCGACRGKPYEVLNLPLPSFSNIGCQTVDRFSELELSNSNEEFLNQMVHILIENERLGCTKSRNEGYDDQNRRTRQNTSVQPLPRKGLGVNKGSQEQGSSRTETETAFSVQIAKLTSEKEELQSNLKTQQISMGKLQTTLDNNHEKQETAQIELKTAFSEKKEELKNTLKRNQETIKNLQTTLEVLGSSRKETEKALSVQIAKLTSEKEELQSNLKTQQITMVKLQTTIDIAQEQPLDTNTCSIGQAKQDKETSTMDRNEESEQIEKSEMEFDKITQDIENPDSDLSSLQSQESTHSSEMKSFTLNSSSTQETLQTLRSENDRLVSERNKLQEENTEIKDNLKENREKLTEANNELDRTRTENTRLKEDCSKTEERQQTLQDENNVYESEIMTFKLENAEFRQSLKENTEKLTQAIDELERIKTENTSLKADCNTRDDDLRSMKTEKGKTDKHIESMKHEKQKLECVVDDLNTKMKHTESELKKTRSDNKTLINSEEARDDEVKSLKTEIDKLDSHMERVKQEKQNLQNKLDNLNAQMKQMESELTTTKTENKKMADSQNEQREESENLRHQIKKLSLPKKKRVVLGLCSERSGLDKSLVDLVTTELTRRLQQRLDMFSLNLTISFSQTPSDVTNGLQVVLCRNIFGTGTSIPESLKGLKADRDMFVLVLHLTSKESISSLTPTSHRVIGSESRQMGGILDMACSKVSGLYDCDFNNTAVDKIASIIRKFVIL